MGYKTETETFPVDGYVESETVDRIKVSKLKTAWWSYALLL